MTSQDRKFIDDTLRDVHITGNPVTVSLDEVNITVFRNLFNEARIHGLGIVIIKKGKVYQVIRK